MNNNQEELGRIINKHLQNNIHDCFPDILAEEILSAGFVRLEDVKVDEEKIEQILRLWRDKGAIKYIGNVAHAIATAKDIIKVKGE